MIPPLSNNASFWGGRVFYLIIMFLLVLRCLCRSDPWVGRFSFWLEGIIVGDVTIT